MADFSAATGGLSVGTLTINLALNTSDLAKKLDEVNRSTKSMADKLKSEFDKAGGTLGNFGERIGQASKAIEKMFGDKAPAALQQFGKEAQRALGLSDSAVKGLAQSASAMEGAFKAAGLAVSTLLSPLGAVLAAALGVAAAVGAVRNAFDTLKGASLFGGGGGNAGRGQEYSRNQQWVMDNVPGAARAADYGERLFTWAGNRAGSEWDRAANTPGSVAETVSKANPWQDIKDAFGRVAKDLESALGPVLKLLAPGTSAADRNKAGTDAAGHNLKLADATAKTMAAAEAARWKAMEDAQEKLGEESMRGAQDLENQRALMAQNELDALAEIQAQNALGYESLKQANADVLAQRLKDEQEMNSRWQALGSGQIGTAAGVPGLAGNALNIVGGAASQYQYTGVAMQGAAQGASNGGGAWGAVIGAIIALASQTESFRKLMSGIEEALGSILPLLSELLEPIVASITGALDVLNPVLKIITKITDALSSALDPIYNLADSIGDLLGVIGDAVDTINTDVLTDWSKESLGDKNDEWGKYGIQDWLTLTPLINKGMAGWQKLLDGDGKGGDPFVNEFTGDGPSAAAQELAAKQQQERRAAWDLDPRNPYYMLNLNAKVLADAEARQREAKENEAREAERAAAALRELADSVTNAVEGYKLEGAMYGAQQSITRDPAAGNPYA